MVIVNYKAVPQQGINPAGDCGPCCLAGVSGISVQEIYDIFGKVDGMTYFCMKNMCLKLQEKGLIKDFENNLPEQGDWQKDPEWNTFGRPSWMNLHPWMNNVSLHIHSGWVGIAMVNLHGRALQERMHANHWVLITGAENGERHADKFVKISCPTLGEYEKSAEDFLMNYGGYNAIWVRT